jgi:hypothetical protein
VKIGDHFFAFLDEYKNCLDRESGMAIYMPGRNMGLTGAIPAAHMSFVT